MLLDNNLFNFDDPTKLELFPDDDVTFFADKFDVFYDQTKFKPFLCEDGTLFNFTSLIGEPVVFDYSLITKEIVVNGTQIISTENNKIKIKIKSIEELKSTIHDFILKLNMINCHLLDVARNNVKLLDYPFIQKYNEEARFRVMPNTEYYIMNQLIMDILFDKYINESPKMTRYEYSLKHVDHSWETLLDNDFFSEDPAPKTSNWLKTALRHEEDRVYHSRNNEKLLGKESLLPSNFDKKVKYPEIFWNQLYINWHPALITSQQFKRSLNKINKTNNKPQNNINNSDKIMYIYNYDKFVETTLLIDNVDNKAFFNNMMYFYYIETYKRIDFIYKLSKRMESKKIETIDRDHCFVKWFHPEVILLKLHNNNLYTSELSKYTPYKPMIMYEEIWQESWQKTNDLDYDKYLGKKYFRAELYELLKYHCEFELNNYKEIADFIRKHYNLINYHDSNKVWIHKNKKHKREREMRISNAMKINDALFWVSDKHYN